MVAARVACVGTSITNGPPSRIHVPYPQLIELALNARTPGGYSVANYGVLSSTSAAHLATWTNNVRNRGFTVLMLESGINDLIIGSAAAAIWATIDTIITQALSDGLVVVLLGILPWGGYSSWNAARQTQTDALLALMVARGGVTYVNPYPTWLAGGVGVTMRADWTTDGLHPNNTGNAVLGVDGTAAIP